MVIIVVCDRAALEYILITNDYTLGAFWGMLWGNMLFPCTLARTQYTCGCRMEMSQLCSTTGLICVWG